MAQRVLHGWSIDVEDWFHILEYAGAPDPQHWLAQERRVELGTRKMLDLLDRAGVRATFFVLGWVAEIVPDLIAEIARRGHEVGSHGHMHQLVSHLGPAAFARDLDLSLAAISHATKRDVKCFRAPGFSITPAENWAFPILAARGITLDSSLFLAHRAHGGYPLTRNRPFDIQLADGRSLVEVPVLPLRLGRREISYSGGGYLRLWPELFLRAAFRAADLRGSPACVYLHPRELDLEQPRMDLPLGRRFKYYVGLDTVLDKIDMLFAQFRFGTLSEVAASCPRDAPLALAPPPPGAVP